MSRAPEVLKVMSPESRRRYLEANLNELAPLRPPVYEGGWWFQMWGHYPAYDDAWSSKREGHTGRSRLDCPECWLARLQEYEAQQ